MEMVAVCELAARCAQYDRHFPVLRSLPHTVHRAVSQECTVTTTRRSILPP